jgi:hypothetical protein
MRSESDIRVPARHGSDPAGLTRRQVLVVALVTCGPLPLLSLGAALVSLPALVERATTTLIPFATVPLDADARVVGPRVEADLAEPGSRTVARRSPQLSIARAARAETTDRPSRTPQPASSASEGNVDARPAPKPPTATLAADAPESGGPGVPPPATSPSPEPPPETPPPPVPVPPPSAAAPPPPSSPIPPVPPLPTVPAPPELPLPPLPLPPLPLPTDAAPSLLLGG